VLRRPDIPSTAPLEMKEAKHNILHANELNLIKENPGWQGAAAALGQR
jgi:hypothetical protein